MSLLSLNAPYPMPGPRQRWRICGWVTLFVTVFLLVFKPFGLANIPQYRTIVILGFGFVTLVGMVLVYVLVPWLLPRFFREQTWTVGHSISQLLVSLLLIATGNLLLATALGFYLLSLQSYLQFIGITLAVGVFPGAGSFFLNHYLLLRKYVGEARQLNCNIHQQPAPEIYAESVKVVPTSECVDEPSALPTKPVITENFTDQKHRLELRDEEGRLALQLPNHELLCLTAEDNYTEVFYLQKGELKKALIRNTLKNMEAAVGHSSRFYRCHRSYIINLTAVEEISGNAQGYKVKLKVMKDLLPVSRSRSKEFAGLLDQQFTPKP